MRSVNPCSLIFILKVSGLGTYYLPPRDTNPSCRITSKDSPYIESRQTSIFFRIVSKRLAPTPPLFLIPAVNRRPMSRLSFFCKTLQRCCPWGAFDCLDTLSSRSEVFTAFEILASRGPDRVVMSVSECRVGGRGEPGFDLGEFH